MHDVLPALNFSKYSFQITQWTQSFALTWTERDRTMGNGFKWKGRRFRINVRKKNSTQRIFKKKLPREVAEPVDRFSLQQKAEEQRVGDLIAIFTIDTCRELPQHMGHPGSTADPGIQGCKPVVQGSWEATKGNFEGKERKKDAYKNHNF